MFKQEKIKPYHEDGRKGEQVEQMFDSIAHSYDTLNHRLSWNIDKRWRKVAINQLKPYKPQIMLDIATGTGDFAIMAAKILQPKKMLCTDFSTEMMNIGKQKVKQLQMDHFISFAKEDCMNLSLPDNQFDAVTTAFAIRNFENLEKGLKEMCRVLKKGGHACILELSTPKQPIMRALFRFYSHTVLPIYGKLISKDPSAYAYLTATIDAFPQGEEIVRLFEQAGFSKATFKRLTFGICTMYFATK